MFERFTDRARKAMHLANQFAGECGSERLDDVHVLVGVCREGGGVAVAVLKELGTTPAAVEVAVGHLPAPREDRVYGRLPRTDLANAVVTRAIEAAKLLGDNYVGTEHLLLALSAWPNESEAALTLCECGVTYDAVLACVKRFKANPVALIDAVGAVANPHLAADAPTPPVAADPPTQTTGGMLVAVLDPKGVAALIDGLLAENARLKLKAAPAGPVIDADAQEGE